MYSLVPIVHKMYSQKEKRMIEFKLEIIASRTNKYRKIKP